LQKRGILRVEDRRGAFLISQGDQQRASYGLLLPPAGLNSAPLFPFRQMAVREILNYAMQHHALMEMLQVNDFEDMSAVDLREGGPFSPRTRGIISLFPFPHRNHGIVAPDRIPLVFQGSYIPDSLPVVTVDTFYGMYRLTRRMIELGHRQIALIAPTPAYNTPPFLERTRGFETALRESSLDYDRELFERARQMTFENLGEVVDLLREYPHITAWACLIPYPAQRLGMAAEALGWRVPEDLSIISYGETALSPSSEQRRVTSYGPDTEQVVRHCFDVLEEQQQLGRYTHNMVLVRPKFYDGDSLAAPRTTRLKIKEDGINAVSREAYCYQQ